jgi:hypothetical protein
MNASNPDSYGGHMGDRAGINFAKAGQMPSITNWQIEQWSVDTNEFQAVHETWTPGSGPYGSINGRILQVQEKYSDLLTNVSYEGLLLSANDYDFCMGWIHHSPEQDANGDKIFSGSPDNAGYGLNYTETQLEGADRSIQEIIDHHSTRKAMADRYV